MVADDSIIRLHPDMGDEKGRAILLHEILHACFNQSPFGQDEELEERVVRSLDHLLLDTLRRNPKIRDYLFGDIKDER